jgi:hypothetical protein
MKAWICGKRGANNTEIQRQCIKCGNYPMLRSLKIPDYKEPTN